jgi:hypothetical protein
MRVAQHTFLIHAAFPEAANMNNRPVLNGRVFVMKQSYSVFAVLVLLAAVPASGAFVVCDPVVGTTASAVLYGNQTGATTFAPNAFGNVSIRFDDGDTATVHLITRGLHNDAVTGLTLVRVSSGATVASFQPRVIGAGSFTASADLNGDLLREIRLNPGNFQFRVHTTAFPTGAIVGPLVLNRGFVTTLTGDQIVGAPGSTTGLGTARTWFRNSATGELELVVDLRAAEIGDLISRIELFEGPVGVAGTSRAVVAENLLLSNGRFEGVIVLDAEVAADILSDPANFSLVVTTNEFPTGALRGQFMQGNDVFIPVVGSVPGARGANWETDLRLFNASFDQTATVMLSFYPRGSGVNTAVSTTTIQIEPRGTRFFDRAMEQLFPGADGIGALVISSDTEIVASARVFNDRRETAQGTFGQIIPGLSGCAAMSRGIITGFVNAAGGPAGSFSARSNIGFFNPTDVTVNVRIQFRDHDGMLLGERVVTLGPWMHTQMPLVHADGLFNLTAEQRNATVTFEADHPIFVYGSVVDNVSGDPVTVLPHRDFGLQPLM